MKTMRFETHVHPFRNETGLTMVSTVEITAETVKEAIPMVQEFIANDLCSKGFKVRSSDVKVKKI